MFCDMEESLALKLNHEIEGLVVCSVRRFFFMVQECRATRDTLFY